MVLQSGKINAMSAHMTTLAKHNKGVHPKNQFFYMKVFRLFRLELIFSVFSRVSTQYVDVQHLIYWQGQRVCDALFFSTLLST
jgi:hypothetical protein